MLPYRRLRALPGLLLSGGAEAEAARLRARGHDVYLGAAGAYSTLGWLPDRCYRPSPGMTPRLWPSCSFMSLPIPCSMSREAAFNEAFATAVGRAGRQSAGSPRRV